MFRTKSGGSVYQNILNELMSRDKEKGLNAMSWKRQFNSSNTNVCVYLGHPDNKVKSEEDALEACVARAVEKVMSI